MGSETQSTMSTLRTGFVYLLKNVTTTGQFLIRNSIGLITQQGRLQQINSAPLPAIMDMQKRSIHQFQIEKNVTYYTKQDGLNIKVDPKTMKIIDPVERRLCIMLSWFGSTPKNVLKYATIPFSQGFDVLTVGLPTYQALFPEQGLKQTVERLLKFLEVNENFSASFVFSFSIGVYLWSEILALVEKDLDRYKPVINRLNVQIWDSLVDTNEFGLGISRGVFPKSPFRRTLVIQYIKFHQWLFYNVSWKHYLAASKQFHANHLQTPCLVFCSKVDVVGSLETNMNFINSWRKMGTPVEIKIFEDTPHIMHFPTHPKEYVETMSNFLEKNGLLFDKPAMEELLENIEVMMKRTPVKEF